MKRRKGTKRESVLNYLKTGKTITPLEAMLMFNSYRLATIIHDLRQEGYDIETIDTETEGGVRFATYKLNEVTENV